MKRFKNILLAVTPGSLDDVALRRAGDLATENDAALTLIDVIEPLPAWRRLGAKQRMGELESALESERSARIHAYANQTGVAGVDAVITTGKPFVEVIRRVLREDHDLVVVGEPAPARHHTGISAGVTQLLRKCPVPVWAIRSLPDREPSILALVDPDPSDPVGDDLNDRVTQLARSMAHRQGARLHIAHAWDVPTEAMFTSSGYVSLAPVEVGSVVSEVEEEHRERLEALVERHGIGDDEATTHLVKGEPGVALPELAAELDTTLIVMGTVARSGVSGMIIGNTAETILRSVSCSVLALKPTGFTSPVRAEE